MLRYTNVLDLVVKATEPLQLDAQDESLARWKASLGLTGAVSADTSGPKVCYQDAP